MRITTVALAVSICFLSMTPLHADDVSIAMKFYPASLDAQWNATNPPGRQPNRIVTTARADLDKTGREDYLAAAYSNGTVAAFRLIKGTSPDTAVLVADANDPLLGGDGRPVIELVDIDNDGVPEMALEFARESWIFRYSDGALTPFAPTRMSKFGPTSNLGAIAFADLDGDGKLEILEIMRDVTAPYIVFSLDASGKFVKMTNPPLFADRFERADGTPVAELRNFRAVAGSYVLRIVNGDQSRRSVVTSAEVKLNGATIFSPGDFKNAQRTLSAPITLAEANSLTVELRSDTQSTLSISIAKQ
jgi:hypothetical protein